MIDPNVYIKELFNNLPKLSPIDADQILIAMYETYFGIYDHQNAFVKSKPLALVALHELEDNTHGSLLYEEITLFIDLEINKKVGMSLEEYMSLPREIKNHIKTVLNRNDKKVNNTLQNLQDSLGKLSPSK